MCSVSVCTICFWCVNMSIHGVLLCMSTWEWVQARECSSLEFKAQALHQTDLGLNLCSVLSHSVTQSLNLS